MPVRNNGLPPADDPHEQFFEEIHPRLAVAIDVIIQAAVAERGETERDFIIEKYSEGGKGRAKICS